MGNNGWHLSMYSNTWKASWQGSVLSHNSKMVVTCFDWHSIPIICTPPPTLPLLPLSYGFHYCGMRVRGLEKPALHTCSAERRHPGFKIFNMAKKRAGRAFLTYINTEDSPHRGKYPNTVRMSKNLKREKVESKWMLDKGMHASVSLS